METKFELKLVNVNANLMSNTGSACAITRARSSWCDKVLDNNQDRIGIWKCWFLRRGENQSTHKETSQSREQNQQQTQPTYNARSGNQTQDTLVGGKHSHHCANPAPLIYQYISSVFFLFWGSVSTAFDHKWTYFTPFEGDLGNSV